MLKKWWAALLLLVSAVAMADIQPGRDYVELRAPQPSGAPAGKVEVIEFFSYTCIHCYRLEPAVESWAAKLPAHVSFRREQIVWSKEMEPLARLFATQRQMGLLDKLHKPVFDAMMRDKQNLADEKLLTPFLKAQGVDVNAFLQTSKSFGMASQVSRAAKMTRDYQVEGTPTFVVAGRYATMAAEPSRLLQVVDELIAKAKNGR